MPEGVETEITRRKLEPMVAGARLTAIRTSDPFLRGLGGLHGTVSSVERHGKMIWFALAEGGGFSLRLSMSGSILTGPAFSAFPKAKKRLVMEFDRPGLSLILMDPRRFAKIEAARAPAKKGWDILSFIGEDRIPAEFEAILRTHRGRIRNLLLDQSKIAGLGNVYANEILFNAGIAPSAAAHRLRPARRESLWRAARAVLKRSLSLGGISMRNYFHPDGEKGRFQETFEIYGKKAGEPCAKCGTPVRVARASQRSTFWCSRCQK